MKKADFLNLSHDQQVEIIVDALPDYQMKAYEDTCFGIFHEISDDDVQERIEYPDDYGTFDILMEKVRGFSESRFAEISTGSRLTPEETKAIKLHIADQDPEGCIGVHGWWLDCDDGKIFMMFIGHSIGAGGIHLEYFSAFETEKKAHECFETFEMHSFM